MISINTLTLHTHHGGPNRVLKYILYWCKNGKADMLIDDQLFCLSVNQAVTITSGQYHLIKKIHGELIALEFTLDFFCKNDSDIELIFHNGLFCHFGRNEIITIQNIDFFKEILLSIDKELHEKPYQYLVSIHSFIELLLVELNRSKIANGYEIWKPDALFLKFLEEIRSNFSHNYPVSRYATILTTTEAKLNEISKMHTNKTAQNVIFSLKISEAKRLLLYERFTTKEIAYQLGFKDPFYFSNFFKKHTSQSPKDYKNTTGI